MRKIAVRNAAGVALLSAAVLAVAGCGGSSKSSSAPPVTVTVAATTPTTTTTVTLTHATTTTASGVGTGSFKDCGSLTSFGQEFAKALAASPSSGTAGLKSQADTFKAFADKAPEAIRSDMRVIADALAKYAEALKGVDLKSGQAPSADVLAKLQSASKEISQPAVSAAGQHISAWVTSHCHA